MKTAISTIIAVTLAFYASPASAKDAAGIEENQVIVITASDLWKKLKGDWKGKDRPTLIDLRSQKEHDKGHLEGARQFDLEGDQFDSKVAKLDRNRTYVVYCRDGTNSAKVVTAWKEKNFQKLYHLKGGWDAYEAVITGRK
jgi:rhodanese-related sulfurtransferase